MAISSDSVNVEKVNGLISLKKPVLGTDMYLPIEFLRARESAYFRGDSVAKTFLSSGTTNAVRSKSHYSHEGLELYKAVSLKTFAEVLQTVSGLKIRKLRGLSLVPPPAEAPDSSLSQMIGWISEFWDVKFVQPDEIGPIIKKARGRPFFVFSTALRLLETIDLGSRYRLGARSVVFETGGFKGQHRDIHRGELYSLISGFFRMPETSIVSEYGMCELASQAYDFCKPDLHHPPTIAQRKFRFPFWARPFILTGLGEATENGLGALGIHDRARVDLPYLLRTQDFAQVDSKGMFQIQGRVQQAPLKGCSIQLEAATPVRPKGSGAKVIKSFPERTFSWESAARHVGNVDRFLRTFLRSNDAIHLLAGEIGSENAARAALRDIELAMPQGEAAWNSAITRATGLADGRWSGAQNWLYILPSSHSIVGIYPLCMNYAAGFTAVARAPSADEKGFLSLFLREFAKIPSNAFRIFGPEYRIGRDALPTGTEAVMAWGEDQTLRQIQEHLRVPLIGFGSSLALAIFPLPASDDVVAKLVKDAMTLGQNGCMSVRLALGMGAMPADELYQKVRKTFSHFWQAPIPLLGAIGIEQEAIEQRAKRVHVSENTPLMLEHETYTDLRAMLSTRPFVLPVFACPSADGLKEKILADIWRDKVHFVAVDQNVRDTLDWAALFPHAEIRALGACNISPWNGTHEGKPLFVT